MKPDEKMIVYVGRLIEAKGMRELITAAGVLTLAVCERVKAAAGSAASA